MNRKLLPMTDLITSLREAKEGSRLLDGQIMFHLFAKPIGNDRGYLWPEDNPSWNFGLVFDKPVSDEVKRRDAREAARNHEKPKDWIQWQREDGRWILMNELRIPRLTTDLSAAVALAERVLPGWHWSIRKKSTNPDFFEGLVTPAAWSYAADRFKASHDSAALALCLAILTAKEKANDRH